MRLINNGNMYHVYCNSGGNGLGNPNNKRPHKGTQFLTNAPGVYSSKLE